MKKFYSAALLAALALLAAGQSQAANSRYIAAACGQMPAAPSLIDGKSATESALRQVAVQVRGFADEAVSFINCLDSQPVSTAYISQPSYRSALAVQRDQAIDRLERTVAAYNAELREFKAQAKQVAAR